jgi:hypothetical protein
MWFSSLIGCQNNTSADRTDLFKNTNLVKGGEKETVEVGYRNFAGSPSVSVKTNGLGTLWKSRNDIL